MVPVNYFPTYAFDPNVFSQDGAPPMAMPTAAAAGPALQSIAPAAAAIARALQMIGFKMAQKLGLRGIPSLKRMMGMVKQLAKAGLAPAAIAAALGIGVDELATLITAQARKKRRRMNVANTRALRRSLRRLKGFETLSHRVSAQLGRAARSGRGHRRGGRCGTCRKSPCAC